MTHPPPVPVLNPTGSGGICRHSSCHPKPVPTWGAAGQGQRPRMLQAPECPGSRWRALRLLPQPHVPNQATALTWMWRPCGGQRELGGSHTPPTPWSHFLQREPQLVHEASTQLHTARCAQDGQPRCTKQSRQQLLGPILPHHGQGSREAALHLTCIHNWGGDMVTTAPLWASPG